MAKRDVWAILEAAEVHVPAKQTDHYGDPLWGERTVGGDGWSFHCEYDGGCFDGFIWIEAPDGQRIEPGDILMDRDAYILHCWSGPGDLQRLRHADLSFWEDQHREALEFEARCKVIALGQG